jgi:hypothetical protein
VHRPELGNEVVSGFTEACADSILGGSSSLSPVTRVSSSGNPLVSSLTGFLVFAKVVVEGGRETGFCGVVSAFFLENQPDFFFFSSSRTTIRSSVKSGSCAPNEPSLK